MKSLIALLFLAWFFCSNTMVGQEIEYRCVSADLGEGDSPRSGQPGHCGLAVPDYIPYEEITPVKIKVNFHFIQDFNGYFNFTPTGDNIGGSYTGLDYVTELVEMANYRLPGMKFYTFLLIMTCLR